MPVYDSIVETVGQTPLVRLNRVGAGLGAELVVKVESCNPCASIKDRAGVAMIRDAQKRGILTEGSVIVEATSGNTGIALAFASAAFGYRLIIIMPETMSRERVSLLRLLGAEVVLTRGGMMKDAVARAREIAESTPNAITLGQFDNPANPEIHRTTTAKEIWADTDGRIDVFVAGVGTGGTITGVGQFLKERKPATRVVAVEPAESAVLSGRPPRPHLIQGIGAGFVPSILDLSVVDEVMPVTEKDAVEGARRLAREEGILCGLSSGAALAAGLKLSERPEMNQKLIVLMLPDTGERYISTVLTGDLT